VSDDSPKTATNGMIKRKIHPSIPLNPRAYGVRTLIRAAIANQRGVSACVPGGERESQPGATDDNFSVEWTLERAICWVDGGEDSLLFWLFIV